MRTEANHRSEMVSQVLFGETFYILEQQDSWLKIQLIHDNYSGFVEKKAISPLKTVFNGKIIDKNIKLLKNNNFCFEIPIGAKIASKLKKNRFIINNNTYEIESRQAKILKKAIINVDKRKYLIENANKMLGTAYFWGGCTNWGIDCSGFSQLLYKLLDIYIPKDVNEQANCGNLVCFLDDAKPGDLAFFADDNNQIIHVGIIDEGDTIIHASGSVRKDKIDYFGILNVDTQRYTHQLYIVKSFL